MRELVMVITDLYLAAESGAGAAADTRLPGIERLTCYARRARIGAGWRDWLVRHLGRADLAAAAPARVAASVLGEQVTRARSDWIATPVYLQAGLSRVHLDHRGLLRLAPQLLDELARDFTPAFAGAGLELLPLPCGELLLRTQAIPAVATPEPERCAGGEIVASLAAGAEAAPLRRTAAEIEMWLHARGAACGMAPPVNALWLWGARGEAPPSRAAAPLLPRAFGADAYLDGLWYLQGSRCEPVPPDLSGVLDALPPNGGVFALRVAEELQKSMPATFVQGLAGLDARFILPALDALQAGVIERVTLIANDHAFEMRGRSALKFWRRAHAGLAGLT